MKVKLTLLFICFHFVCAAQYVVVGEGEYQCFFIDAQKHLWGIGNVKTIGAGFNPRKGLIIPVAVQPKDLRFRTVAGTLHGGLAADLYGFVWTWGEANNGQSGDGNLYPRGLPEPIKIEKDSAGHVFNGVSHVFSSFAGNKWSASYAIKGTDSTLWVWGTTFGGMRGNGTKGDTVLRPVQIVIPGNRKVRQAVAGQLLIILCSDGTVWTCGNAGLPAANLGYAATGNDFLSLHQLRELKDIIQIAGGMAWNYALTKDYKLYGWGAYGAYLGFPAATGNGTPVKTPTLLTNIMKALPSPIKKIVVNSNSTHVVLQDGTLWGWGDNAQGTIGNGTELDFSKTTKPYSWDFKPGTLLQVSPVQIAPGKNDFIDVFGSSNFIFYTYAEDANGNLYAWGRNKSSVIANGVIGATPDIQAAFPNSWDVPVITRVFPFERKEPVVVTSPYCALHPDAKPCHQFPIPLADSPAIKINLSLARNNSLAQLKEESLQLKNDAPIISYRWRQLSGPSDAIITLPSDAHPVFSAKKPGKYVFELTVTDSGWRTAKDSVEIELP